MKIIWGLSPRGLYNMGVFLGIAKSIFHVPGVETTIFENLTGADYTEELVRGRFDLGTCGTPPLFAALERTRSYGVIGTSNSNFPPFYLIASPTIEKVEHLRGKVIAINKLRTCPDSVTRQLLTEARVPHGEVRIIVLVQPSRFIGAIDKREIDAAMLWEPWVSFVERVYKWRVLTDCPRVVHPSNYAHLIYAKNSLLEKSPRLVRNFIDAYRKSIEYSKTHIHELLKLDYPMDYATPQDLEKAVRREVPLWNTNPALDYGILRRAETELKDQGVITPAFSVQKFVVQV